ncbi:MAG: hypothetical protein EXS14_10125 [Planctomycetes bacterium]|nr:hypothetical protein [Planctomycetota bacterium]
MQRIVLLGAGAMALILLLAARGHLFHDHHAHGEDAAALSAAQICCDNGDSEAALVALEQAHPADSPQLRSLLLRIAEQRRGPTPAPSSNQGVATDDPIRLGSGRHVYEWVPQWSQLPEGMGFGNTHGGIVLNAAGEVLLNTDTAHAVMAFSQQGKFLRSFGSDLAGGAHGMVLGKENEREVLYVAHTRRHEVLKCTPTGEVLLAFPWPKECAHYKQAEQFNPTSVALAPDGTVFIADGYGLSWVHHYDAAGKWLSAFGGRGAEPGEMQTPHGLLLDTRTQPATLLVADRENHRLQRFKLDGTLLKVISGDLRRPCKLSLHGTDLAVADLAGRVTVLDAEDKLVTHLGDQPLPEHRANNGVPKTLWKDGEFLAPHGIAFDSEGNLYVMDWLSLGRVTKLKRIK